MMFVYEIHYTVKFAWPHVGCFISNTWVCYFLCFRFGYAAVRLVIYMCSAKEVAIFAMSAAAGFVIAANVGVATFVVGWKVFRFAFLFSHNHALSFLNEVEVVKDVLNGNGIVGLLCNPRV